MSDVFKTLVRFAVQREDVQHATRARAIMPDVQRVARGSANEIRREVLRQALIAVAAELPAARHVMTAQIKAEMVALRDVDISTLPPIRDVDIAQHRSEQVTQ